ncbi:p53-like transcription factor, partial [Polychaeton citri CBS 116435]
SSTPSSAASSLQQYSNYPQNHYTNLSSYSGPVSLPQAFVPSSYGGARAPSLLDQPGQVTLPPPLRSPISGLTNAPDREACSNGTPYLGRDQLPPGSQYDPYNPTTPRSYSHAIISSPASASYQPHMASSSAYSHAAPQSECADFPWVELQVLAEMTCEGQSVTPEVHARVEKGFFKSTGDGKWTCYRRNYFSVLCSFELHPLINNGRLFVKHHNNMEQVQAMGIRLSAVVDGPQGKNIELVQHTPKRDQGPKTKVDIVKVAPTPTAGRIDSISPHGTFQVSMSSFHATGATLGPQLPLQQDAKTSGMNSQLAPPFSSYNTSPVAQMPAPGQSTSHTFERVQFKQATANNGKRRASQQYFHLLVELFADCRQDGAKNPEWVKVAQRLSEKIVVRGRSPSHYHNEGAHTQAGRSGGAGGSGGYSTAGASYGGLSTGGFRSSVGGYGGAAGGGGIAGYRGSSQYTYNTAPEQSLSGSSTSSIDGAPAETDTPMDTVMSDVERSQVQEYDGYQYYPNTIYEGVPAQLPPLAKLEPTARYSTEPRQYAVKAEYPEAVPGAQWQSGACSRFQGVDSSRGYYPDLHATGYTS